jgi:hypothetical protein
MTRRYAQIESAYIFAYQKHAVYVVTPHSIS